MATDTHREAKRPLEDALVSVLLFGSLAALYGAGAANTCQGGDASEYMAVAGAGGVLHPPGYPVQTALMRLASHLPASTVAWRASFVSALLGAGTVTLLFALLRRLTGRWIPALVAALALGLSFHFWRYATVAEVFTGCTLSATLVLLSTLSVDENPHKPTNALLAGLALATGIAHHHTIVFLAPVVAWALVRVARGRRPLSGIAAFAAGSLPGFISYGLLALPGGAWRWGDTRSLPGVVHHFLRRDFGTFQLTGGEHGLDPLAHPLHWASELPTEFFGIYALLGLLGLALAFRAPSHRGWLLAVMASLLLAGPFFLGLFNLPASLPWTISTSRFHLLANTLFAVFIGWGAHQALRWGSGSRVLAWALLGALAVPLFINLQRAPHRGGTVVEDYLRLALGTVEPGSLVLAIDDAALFGSLYLQEVEGLRPDVAWVHPEMLGYPWYRQRLLERHPDLVLERRGEVLGTVGLVQANLERAPVYASFGRMQDEAVRQALPMAFPVSAVLMRIVPEDTPMPHPGQVEAQMRAAFEAHAMGSRVASDFHVENTYDHVLWKNYALAFETLANAWAAFGEAEGEARCRATARDLDPWTFPDVEPPRVGAPGPAPSPTDEGD